MAVSILAKLTFCLLFFDVYAKALYQNRHAASIAIPRDDVIELCKSTAAMAGLTCGDAETDYRGFLEVLLVKNVSRAMCKAIGPAKWKCLKAAQVSAADESARHDGRGPHPVVLACKQDSESAFKTGIEPLKVASLKAISESKEDSTARCVHSAEQAGERCEMAAKHGGEQGRMVAASAKAVVQKTEAVSKANIIALWDDANTIIDELVKVYRDQLDSAVRTAESLLCGVTDDDSDPYSEITTSGVLHTSHHETSIDYDGPLPPTSTMPPSSDVNVSTEASPGSHDNGFPAATQAFPLFYDALTTENHTVTSKDHVSPTPSHPEMFPGARPTETSTTPSTATLK